MATEYEEAKVALGVRDPVGDLVALNRRLQKRFEHEQALQAALLEIVRHVYEEPMSEEHIVTTAQSAIRTLGGSMTSPTPEPSQSTEVACERCEGSRRVCRGCDNAVHGLDPEAHRHMWADHDGIPTDCGPVVVCPNCAARPEPPVEGLQDVTTPHDRLANEAWLELERACDDLDLSIEHRAILRAPLEKWAFLHEAAIRHAAMYPEPPVEGALEEAVSEYNESVRHDGACGYDFDTRQPCSCDKGRIALALIAAARSGHDGLRGEELEGLFEDVYGAAQWLGTPTIEDGEGPNQAALLINLAVNRLAAFTGSMEPRSLSPDPEA